MAPEKKRPTKDLLLEQYKVAVDEYRFQVELNWKRSQYYFVLNAAILVAGVGLLNSDVNVPRGVIAALFGVGLLAVLLALLANSTQRSYYKASREQMQDLAEAVGLGGYKLKTTTGMGSGLKRLGRVTTFHQILLGVLGVADLGGIFVSLCS